MRIKIKSTGVERVYSSEVGARLVAAGLAEEASAPKVAKPEKAVARKPEKRGG